MDVAAVTKATEAANKLGGVDPVSFRPVSKPYIMGINRYAFMSYNLSSPDTMLGTLRCWGMPLDRAHVEALRYLESKFKAFKEIEPTVSMAGLSIVEATLPTELQLLLKGLFISKVTPLANSFPAHKYELVKGGPKYSLGEMYSRPIVDWTQNTILYADKTIPENEVFRLEKKEVANSMKTSLLVSSIGVRIRFFSQPDNADGITSTVPFSQLEAWESLLKESGLW
jgi:hypothetical protein